MIVRILWLTCLLAFVANNLCASKKDSFQTAGPYHVNFKTELIVLAPSSAIVGYGYLKIPGLTKLTVNEAMLLRKDKVNRFDRTVFENSSAHFDQHDKTSTFLALGFVSLPSLLLLDKNMRNDWKTLALLYYEAQLANLTLELGTSLMVQRPRPFSYYTDLSMETRTANESAASFYSGHTSTVAVSSFFIAKVYSDYHQFSLGQKALIYAAATIPPALVGHYRLRAGKHFRTDVMAGIALGAASGILVPELHKRRKNKSLTYTLNLSEQYYGLHMTYRF